MRLKKIDYTIKENKKLKVCEDPSQSTNGYLYPSVVGLFGKNGVGKTRTLSAVKNTIESAIKSENSELLDGISENSKNKVLFLNAETILNIKKQETKPINSTSKYSPFDENQIKAVGIQDYLIENGKSILTFLGMQWHELEELPSNSPARIFSKMFEEIFGVKFRTVFDPVSFKPDVQVDSLNIDRYELSDGEWIVVFYLLLITLAKCTEGEYSDAIVIIDEIENHLNPGNLRCILIYLCNTFKEKGQIWIASHSLDVLLWVNSRHAYRLEKKESGGRGKNTIIYKPSVKSYEIIKQELFGNAENADVSLSFREEEMQHYISEFMSQSLKEPAVVKCINKNDIQLKMFLKCLNDDENEIKILDFGAGEGRIGDALKDLKDNRILYYAYEIKEEKAVEIEKKKYAKKVYTKRNEIDEKFNVVLLCNVLHEIDILVWVDELDFIFSVLSENGILVFIEDMELPEGEYIGETGFLLMDGETTKVLFGENNVSLILANEEKYRDRILCAIVDKNSKVIEGNVISALELLKKRNVDKIWQIRRNKKDKFVINQNTLGKTIARATQLAVNSSIALEYLQSIDNSSKKGLNCFVSSLVNAIGIINYKEGDSLQGIKEVLDEVILLFKEDNSADWVFNKNVVLSGSLVSRLNHILERINMKIYSEQFGDVIDSYVNYEIYKKIENLKYQELLKQLLCFDLSNKYAKYKECQ